MRGLFLPKKFSKRCLVLSIFDAYQLRRKIFFLLGLPFTPPYLRIYEGIFHRTKVMAINVTLNLFLSEGWLWPPQMSGYVKGLFFGTTKYGNTLLGDGRNHHLNRFQKFFLKLGLQKGVWKSELVKGLSKKVSELGLTLPPPHFRISERLFKNLSPAPWLSGSQMSEYMKASFNCTLTIEYPPSGRPQPRRHCTYTDEREMPVRTTGENLLDDGLKNAMLLCILKF